MGLRDFQQTAMRQVFEAWGEPNVFNVMLVMPTGSGKTVTFCAVVEAFRAPTVVVAHRQELVSQAALALNRERVPHSLIAPKEVIRQTVTLEQEEHGYSLFNASAQTRVASVDTLIGRNERWFPSVQLVVIDEGHHVLRANKWGQVMAKFPNARGLYPTAHALRADGKGLGRRGGEGLVDRLIVGPSCRQLINRGFLTDYKVFCPETDLDFSDVTIGASGEYSLPKLRDATHKSNRIVGNVVKHHVDRCNGKLGIMFAVDVEAAKELQAECSKRGVPSAIITAHTPVDVRASLMRQFRERKLYVLISVDCLGEGVDVPAVEVVHMVRKTASFQLYSQQFGRVLRTSVAPEYAKYWDQYSDSDRKQIIAGSAKPVAFVYDYVGNIGYHLRPDVARTYTLLNADKRSRSKSDGIPLRICLQCTQPYERFLTVCPYCNTAWVPVARTSPEAVDGDLVELSPAVLEAMRQEIERVDGPAVFPRDAAPPVRAAIQRNWNDRAGAQALLRQIMALWGGWQTVQGRTLREAQKLFYLVFGIDYMSAQALNAADAAQLALRIQSQLDQNGVIAQ